MTDPKLTSAPEEQERPPIERSAIAAEIRHRLDALPVDEQERVYFQRLLEHRLEGNHNLKIPDRLWEPEYARLPEQTDVLFYYPPLTERPLTRNSKGGTGPANLLLLGGALEREGYESIVVEGEDSGISLDQFLEVVRKTKPKHVCLSLTWGSAENGYQTAKAIKALYPGIIISAGGPQTHGLSEKILALEPAIDFVVEGSGETATVRIQQAISHGCSRPEDISAQIGDLPGVYSRFHTPGEATSNDPAEIVDTPCMGYDKVFFGLQNDPRSQILVQVLDSHGCTTTPACTMCGESARREAPRPGDPPHIQYRQPELLIRDMKNALESLPSDSRILYYGLGQNGFAREGFGRWIINLLELIYQTNNQRALQKNPYEVIVITTPMEIAQKNRLDLERLHIPDHLKATYEMVIRESCCTTPLQLFRALGGTMVFVGYESKHASMTSLLGKPGGRSDTWQRISTFAREVCAEADIQMWAGLITLGPFTTLEEYEETIDLITEFNTDTDEHFSIPMRQLLADLEIFPGTALDRSFDPGNPYFVPVSERESKKSDYLNLLLAHSKQTGNRTLYRLEDPVLAVIAHIIQRPIIEDCMRSGLDTLRDMYTQTPDENDGEYWERLKSLGYPYAEQKNPAQVKEYTRQQAARLNGDFARDVIEQVKKVFSSSSKKDTLNESISQLMNSYSPGMQRTSKYEELIDTFIQTNLITVHLSRLVPHAR